MKVRLLMSVLLLLLLPLAQVTAQGERQVQELTSQVSPENQMVYFDLFGMQAGTTLYMYVESNDFDTVLGICDISCEDVYDFNDDIGDGNLNSALSFTFEVDGDYSIVISDYATLSSDTNSGVSGSFRLLIGYNAPDVMNGLAVPTGAEIAVPYVAGSSTTTAPPAQPVTQVATGERQVQEFYSQVSPENEFVYFDLFGMQAGTTIYLYAESEEFDTLLGICDIDCAEIYDSNDDIGNGNLNSALQYTFTADGDYSIFITDCCVSDVTGIFRVLLGFNAPDVLTGEAFPNGGRIAVPYEPTYTDLTAGNSTATVTGAPQIQQFYGSVNPQSAFAYYDIFGAQAGETIYLYVESDEFDTVLGVCDIDCIEVFEINDDIAEDNLNSALQYTFTANGDYSIVISDYTTLYTEEDSNVTGTFRLLLGYNAPQVLTGDAVPNGAQIAEVYEANPVTVVEGERTESTTCDGTEMTERPALSGPVQTAETPNFIIHYTLSGEDAATESFVQEVAAFLETMMQIETQQFGWPAPPRDCGEGGDTRFDFYLEEILSSEGILGYAQPGNVVGDNPNSSYPETWAAYSYMTIDNDFQGVEAPLAVMRATIAHEFHHSIQFGYDINDQLNWYYESTASWMETQVSTADQDATGYTEAVMTQPDLCIGTSLEDSGVRIYGEWLLIDSLAQDYGAASIIKLWEFVADYEGMEPYYQYLASLGTTPQDVLRRYSVRNLLLDYGLGKVFPESVDVEAIVNGVGTITPRDGVQEMSADYVLIRHKGVYTFSINQPNLSMVVVGVNRATGQAQVFDLGQGGTVDTTGFANAYLIVLNNSQHTNPDACTDTTWSINVTDGTGAAMTPANGEVFSIANFVPAG